MMSKQRSLTKGIHSPLGVMGATFGGGYESQMFWVWEPNIGVMEAKCWGHESQMFCVWEPNIGVMGAKCQGYRNHMLRGIGSKY